MNSISSRISYLIDAEQPNDNTEILNGWKEISRYMNCGVRTVQRWERHSGLPIHSAHAGPRAPRLAMKSELDQWLRRPISKRVRESCHVGENIDRRLDCITTRKPARDKSCQIGEHINEQLAAIETLLQTGDWRCDGMRPAHIFENLTLLRVQIRVFMSNARSHMQAA